MPKVLLGFMGAGKTTIGSLLNPAFADMDALLVQRLGMPISGGGIVLKPENRKLLKKNPCNIYLRIDFERLYQRLAADPATKRPLFLNKKPEEFRALYEQRLPLYEEVATHVIDVADKTPEEIVEIIRCL